MTQALLRPFFPPLVALALLAEAAPVFAQKAIVVVRHAEKVDESRDPLLSEAGIARAEALQRAVRSMDIKAVYVTQFQRTWLTADAVLKARGLTPVKLPAEDMAAVAERMKVDHPNDVVLAVGHSNTTPKLLKALGVTESIEIASDEYDNLFIVIPSPAGPPTLLRLRY